MGIQDIAKKMAAAKAAGGGNYLRDGKGRLIVKSIAQDKLYKGDTFIAELQVERSDSYSDAIGTDGKPVLANAPGSTVSFIQQFDQFADTAFPNTKAFLLALVGEAEENVSEEAFVKLYEKAVSKGNPFRGWYLDFETYRKPSRKTGKILTLPKWTHVPQQLEEIAARRAQLDGADAAKAPEAK